MGFYCTSYYYIPYNIYIASLSHQFTINLPPPSVTSELLFSTESEKWEWTPLNFAIGQYFYNNNVRKLKDAVQS